MNQGNILVALEFDNDPRQVMGRAIHMAQLLGCGLDVLFCEPSSSPLFGGLSVSSESKEIRLHIQQLQEQMAEELAAPAREAGLSVSTTVLQERPVQDGILARALDSEPCIVMKGTQFRSKAERSILVDADWQLMRSCPFPLWLVKNASIREELVVVAAVDPTHTHDKPAELDQVIVDTAKSIAKSAGGEVHLFHTYQRLVDVGTAANRTVSPTKLPIDKIDQRMKKEHRLALDELAARNNIDADHTHQLPGRTQDILPTFVRSNNADLVVMGALARWRIKRMIIGSTAERVLDHLPCDVLIVQVNDH